MFSRQFSHFLFLLGLVTVSKFGFTQEQVPVPEESKEELLFISERPWKLSRFYALGKLDEKNKRVSWAGSGVASPLQFSDETCRNATSLKINSFSFVPTEGVEASAAKAPTEPTVAREILESGDWFAVEVLTDLLKDQIYLQLQTSAGLCEAKADLLYSWAPGKRGVRPLLMLGPARNLHGNLLVRFDVPELKLGRSGITLDLLAGYWKATYPNGSAGTNPTIHYAPITMARGEWYAPFHERVGLLLGLEQSAAAFGRADTQSVLLSDYNLGIFYDFLLYKGDAWVNRLALNYRGHLTDDNSNFPSIHPANKSSSYLAFNGGTHFYFSRYYMVGGEYSWAPMANLAGNGVKQGFAEWLLRFGIRLNSSVQFIGEFGQRSYKVQTIPTESMLMFNGGFRLKL